MFWFPQFIPQQAYNSCDAQIYFNILIFIDVIRTLLYL